MNAPEPFQIQPSRISTLVAWVCLIGMIIAAGVLVAAVNGRWS